MSSENTDRLYWLAFASLFDNEAGELGDNDAFFLSTNTQRAPPVEPYHETYKNHGIHNIGNQLLSADNLFYNPSSSTATYVSALEEYLSWVDLGGNPSDAQVFRLKDAKKSWDRSRTAFLTELNGAEKRFLRDAEMGMTENQTFDQWAMYNAPGYACARNDMNRALAQYQHTVMSLGGSLGQKWNSQMQKLAAARDDAVVPGYNMAVAFSAPPTITEASQAASRPTASKYAPAFLISHEYNNIVSSWQKNAQNTVEKNNLYTLDLSTGRDSNDTDFGHVSVEGDLEFDYRNIFSFGTDTSFNTEETLLDEELTDSNVSIDVYWENSHLVQIQPGAWDISDPLGTFPNLRADAPENAKMLVRPTKALVVSKLGFDIEFSEDVKDDFEEKLSSVQESDGFVRVFGVPVSVGTHTSATTTHTGTWDSDSGTFNVAPTVDGYATVVAIVGEKIQTG